MASAKGVQYWGCPARFGGELRLGITEPAATPRAIMVLWGKGADGRDAALYIDSETARD
jgi:hypothetical protein